MSVPPQMVAIRTTLTTDETGFTIESTPSTAVNGRTDQEQIMSIPGYRRGDTAVPP